MNNLRKLLLVTRFAVLRMLRDPVSAIILVGTPLAIIPILGAIFSNIPGYGAFLKGAPDMMAFVATGMIVMFQLFSGRYSLDGTRDALLSDRRWRIVAAPCAPGIHALVAVTRVVLGVRWGNLGVVVLVLGGAALFSQLSNLTFLLLTRAYTAAATIAWMFAWGSAALGGLMFPLPTDRPFWHFMVTYGTPYSLAQTAVVSSAVGGSQADVITGVGALFALSALFALLVVLLGRRRLA
jgi:hypothetical protein